MCHNNKYKGSTYLNVFITYQLSRKTIGYFEVFGKSAQNIFNSFSKMEKLEILTKIELQEILYNFLQNGESRRESVKIFKFGELFENDYNESEMIFYYIPPIKIFEMVCVGEK